MHKAFISINSPAKLVNEKEKKGKERKKKKYRAERLLKNNTPSARKMPWGPSNGVH
jgi:hypothetical protein